jgi:hypothetical protein
MDERGMTTRTIDRNAPLRPRRGLFRQPDLPDAAALRNRELIEVVDALGRPMATASLGLGRLVAFWRIKRTRVEIIFDEHHRAERISFT